MSSRVLTAVAWPYANGPRHIGHVSGFGVPSDVFSRYMRMSGHDVLMVSGTDEHGTPILVQAEREGMSTRETADKYNRVIVEDLAGLGLSYDLFTRTTTRNHYAVVQDLFLGLHKNGYVVPKVQLGAVSPSTGRTLPDRYIEGTCPICGYESARGDQCDNCGNQLDPADLINPRSRINGEAPKFVETEHFFLDLPALAGSLGKWLAARTDWRPNVLKFSQNLLEDLKPRAITRDLDWGVPVPLDGWRDQPLKRLYVWFDAVIGYLSASVEWAQRTGDPDAWKQWWLDPDALSYYFMGKDNIVFHTVIWPGILLGHNGAGDHGGTVGPRGELRLPDEVVSSEFLTMSGSKFSTSRGRVIYVGDFLREFGPDALRYYIAVAGPETTDADFTWDEFVRRTNFELANEWGNLVNRSLSMAHKNNGSCRPPARSPTSIISCSACPASPSTPWGSCSVATGSSWPSPRPCGWPGRPTSTSPIPRPGSWPAILPDATPSCTLRCRWSPTSTPCSRRSSRMRPSRCTKPWVVPACGPRSLRSARSARTAPPTIR